MSEETGTQVGPCSIAGEGLRWRDNTGHLLFGETSFINMRSPDRR